MFSKFEINGEIDTIQTFKISSVINNIQDVENFGSIFWDLKGQEADYYNKKFTYGYCKEDIRIDDYNFDGINDISIVYRENAGGYNRVQTIWIYNIQTNKYEKEKILSESPIWRIDREKKTIILGWRNGFLDYGTVSYQLVKGNFVQVASEFSSYNGEVKIQTIITKKLVNDKWVEKKEIINFP